jgi:acyl-CoA thioester hydrolase
MRNVEAYIRKVQYHETDKMGITHHSNYVKWMEEARIAFLDQVGYGYARLEREGICSPVTGIEGQYKSPTTFDDIVCVQVEVEEFKGVRLVIRYTMTHKETGALVFTGKSHHCFVNGEGKPVILKKQVPELDRILKELTVKE